MIKINLLGDEIRQDSSAAIWLLGMLVSFVGFFLITTLLYLDVTSSSAQKQQEVKDLESQLAQLKERTKEVSGLEQMKTELNQKIAVIAELKLNKFGPVRVMDDLNISIPEKAWLTEVREKGNQMSISGFALDGQTVATFMDSLEKSDYFDELRVETKQAVRDGVKIQSFILLSKVSYAGKLKLEKSDSLEQSEKKESAADKR